MTILRWQPRLQTILVVVNMAILLLPLAGIGILRLYENMLVRRTEAELIAQGAVIGAAFTTNIPSLPNYGLPLPAQHPPQNNPDYPLQYIPADIDLTNEVVRPPATPATRPSTQSRPQLRAIGRTLTPLLRASTVVTLAGVRVVDTQGRVIATSREDLGLSLAHREEVQRALTGEYVSLLRERIDGDPNAPLSSISRGAKVRVFVTMPLIRGETILGAVLLSRTPLTIEGSLYRNLNDLLWAGLVIVAVVVVVSIFTSLTITRPVQRLIQQTEQIARGELGGPIPRPVTREITQLSVALARMAQTLTARGNYIRTFAQAVSHEFKTPLTAMGGTVELLRDHEDTMTQAERQHFLDNLRIDIDRLSRLVRRLLDLARADVAAPTPEYCVVLPLLQDLVSRHQAQGLALTLHHDPAVQIVPIAAETLSTILTNLLDNARQHGGEGVTVQLITQAHPHHVDLYVRDDGPSISHANQQQIFEPFFTTARATGGTGLGLSVVRSLLIAHGGQINLELLPKGTGFCVRLPVAYPVRSINP